MAEPMPVLVAGAGPVGLAAALALRARDVPVVLLEADPPGRVRAGSRALYVHHDSLVLLESMSRGVGTRLAERGILWNVRRTLFEGRQVYARAYPPFQGGLGACPQSGSGGCTGGCTPRGHCEEVLPPFTSLRQADTERILLDACVHAGVTVQWNSRVVDVTPDAGGVTVKTASGSTWRASHLLGADGARSTVRRSVGIDLHGSTADGFHVVVDIVTTAEEQRRDRVFHYRHPAMGGRHVLTVPYAGGFQVDLQCGATDDPEAIASTDIVRAWLPRVIGAVPDERITWISVYRFRQLIADTFADTSGRVLLIGEAAHLFPPFGARGMNSGFVDAHAAATAVTAARRDSAEQDAAVAEFVTKRRAAALQNSHAAGAALEHMRPSGGVALARQFVAARLAPVVPRFGEWLERAPYGPSSPVLSGY